MRQMASRQTRPKVLGRAGQSASSAGSRRAREAGVSPCFAWKALRIAT